MDIDVRKEVETWEYAFGNNPKDFFEYYSYKLRGFQKELREQQDLTERYKDLAEKNCVNEDELSEKDKTIHRLQIENSSLVTTINKERGSYLELSTDFDLMKAQCDEYYTKFQALLLMTKQSEQDVEYYLIDNPDEISIIGKICQVQSKIKRLNKKKTLDLSLLNPKILAKQIKIMEERICDINMHSRSQEQTFQNEIDTILRDRNIESDTSVERIKDLSTKLKESNELLFCALNESTECKQKYLTREEAWLKERDMLIKSTNTLSDEIPSYSHTNQCSTAVNSAGMLRRLKRELAETRNKLETTDLLLDEYKLQTLRLQKELSRANEKEELTSRKSKENVEKFTKKIQMLRNQLEDTDKRRKIQMTGYLNEVKILKKLLSTIEKKNKIIQMNVAKQVSMKTQSTSNQEQEKKTDSAPSASSKYSYICKNHVKHCPMNKIVLPHPLAQRPVLSSTKRSSESKTNDERVEAKSNSISKKGEIYSVNSMFKNECLMFKRMNLKVSDLEQRLRKPGVN